MAIGGAAVFICVGGVVILRAIHFRATRHKRESKKHQQEENNKNSSLSLSNQDGLEMKDVITASSDDKDPDIIPSNIGTYFSCDKIVIQLPL